MKYLRIHFGSLESRSSCAAESFCVWSFRAYPTGKLRKRFVLVSGQNGTKRCIWVVDGPFLPRLRVMTYEVGKIRLFPWLGCSQPLDRARQRLNSVRPKWSTGDEVDYTLNQWNVRVGSPLYTTLRVAVESPAAVRGGMHVLLPNVLLLLSPSCLPGNINISLSNFSIDLLK